MRLFFYLFIFTYALKAYPQVESVVLKVNISHLRNTKGQIMISVYSDPKTFPKAKGMLEEKIIYPITGDKITIEFKNLKIGNNYAVALLHDEDRNGKMTKNLIAYPKEGFGFSKNIHPTFRAPNWEECNFKLLKGLVINIEMIYK